MNSTRRDKPATPRLTGSASRTGTRLRTAGTAHRDSDTIGTMRLNAGPAPSGIAGPRHGVCVTQCPDPVRPCGATGQASTDRSGTTKDHGRSARSWPLWLLAAPAAVEVWSGWVGIGRMTGFGQVYPLPGICDSLHLDSAVTLPIGVEAYAAYALRACLSASMSVSRTARLFAAWSAAASLLLGMAGQVAYHLLTQAGAVRAPWGITTAVSCLPVLVLGMGAALAHLLRADAPAAAWGPAAARTRSGPGDELAASGPDHMVPANGGRRTLDRSSPAGHPDGPACPDWFPHGRLADAGLDPVGRGPHVLPHRIAKRRSQLRIAEARQAAGRLRTAGKGVSRRTLRAAGVRGSNADLGTLARILAGEAAGGGDSDQGLHGGP